MHSLKHPAVSTDVYRCVHRAPPSDDEKSKDVEEKTTRTPLSVDDRSVVLDVPHDDEGGDDELQPPVSRYSPVLKRVTWE